MSAVVDHQVNQTSKKETSAPSGGGLDGGLAAGSCGPAALAQQMIYEIMALYAKIIEIDAKQKIVSIEAQTEAAQSEADATKAAGLALGMSAIAAGFITIVGAIVAAKLGHGNSETINSANEEVSNLNGEIAPMSKIENIDTNFGAADRELGPQDEDQNLVQARIRELKSGRYAGDINPEEEGDVTVRAVRQMKREGGDEFDNFRETLRDKLNRKTKQVNTKTSEVSNEQQRASIKSQVANSTASALSGAGQGIGQSYRGADDADATLSRTTGQMAGSTSQDFGTGMAQAYNAQNAEVQVLEKIHQTNSASGG